MTIALVTCQHEFCAIVTVRYPITPRCVENTLLCAICARPPVWIFYSFEVKVTLAITEEVRHVTSVLTQGLLLCTASISQKNATDIVATVERDPIGVQLTLILASIRVFVAPIWAICGRIANLLTTKALRLILAVIEAILLITDWSKSLVRMCLM